MWKILVVLLGLAACSTVANSPWDAEPNRPVGNEVQVCVVNQSTDAYRLRVGRSWSLGMILSGEHKLVTIPGGYAQRFVLFAHNSTGAEDKYTYDIQPSGYTILQWRIYESQTSSYTTVDYGGRTPCDKKTRKITVGEGAVP